MATPKRPRTDDEEKVSKLFQKVFHGLGPAVDIVSHLNLKERLSGRLVSNDKQRPWMVGADWGEVTCCIASKRGDLGFLKWLRNQNPRCPWDKKTCSKAAGGGHLEVLKWLRSQNPPCPWDEGTCSIAASAGDLKILKWVRSQNPPCPWDQYVCYWAAKTVEFGEVEVLEWLIEVKAPGYENF